MPMDHDSEDQEAVAAINMELALLGRLIYKNRNQHRGSKYFALLVEVKRTCRVFVAPKIPDLLAEGLCILARIPDSRNSRAREAWVRSASCELRRSRSAVGACAATLEVIVKASRHLAHQVSQTYFMALSVTLLACISRIFACYLHFGGRLLEVHGALLRAMLAQPCISDCLSASTLEACRLRTEDTCLLELLRSKGRGSSRRRKGEAALAGKVVSNSPATNPACSAAGLNGPKPPASTLGDYAGETRGNGSVGAGGDGGAGGANDEDTGVRVGQATVKKKYKGELTTSLFLPRLRAGAASVAAMRCGDGGGKGVRTCTDENRSAEPERRKAIARGQERDSVGTGGGCDGGFSPRVRKKQLPMNKVVLAADFSDSSVEDVDDDNGRRSRSPREKSKGSAQTEKPWSARSPSSPETKETLISQSTGSSNASNIGCLLAPNVCASSDGDGGGGGFTKNTPRNDPSKTSNASSTPAANMGHDVGATSCGPSVSIAKSPRERHPCQGSPGGDPERSIDEPLAALAKTVITMVPRKPPQNGEAGAPQRNETERVAEAGGVGHRDKPHAVQKGAGGTKRLSGGDRRGKNKRGKSSDKSDDRKGRKRRNAIDDIFGSL